MAGAMDFNSAIEAWTTKRLLFYLWYTLNHSVSSKSDDEEKT